MKYYVEEEMTVSTRKSLELNPNTFVVKHFIKDMQQKYGLDLEDIEAIARGETQDRDIPFDTKIKVSWEIINLVSMYGVTDSVSDGYDKEVTDFGVEEDHNRGY